MKKTIVILMLLIALTPFTAFAQIQKSNNITIHDWYYDSFRDQYILDYTIDNFSDELITIFIHESGTTYTKKWDSSHVNLKIYHNCNGTYNYNFNVNGLIVGYIYGLDTTQIQNEVCSQQIPGTDQTDINPKTTYDSQNKQFEIRYKNIDGGNQYTIERSDDGGNTWTSSGLNGSGTGGTNTNGSGATGTEGTFIIDSPGYYRITVKNQNNQIITKDYIGQSEFTYNSNTCNGCTFLNEMLSCPAWDDYMSEFSNMISQSIPNLSDYSDALIDKLAEQNVEPNTPTIPTPYNPGYELPDTDLPQKIETDIDPDPQDFTPQTGGDGSGPVQMTDPTNWTPSNDDIGYEFPNPTPSTQPNYQMTDPDTNGTPTYQTTETTGQIPNYQTTATTGTIPTYQTNSTNDDIPAYQMQNNGNNTIPSYQIQNPNNQIPIYQYNEGG